VGETESGPTQRIHATPTLTTTTLLRGATEMAAKKLTPVERFWTFVDKNGPMHPVLGTRCWLWTGYCNPNGYAKFWTGVRYQGGHVFAYETFVGPVPAGEYTLHHCDVQSCVRYEGHLFTGTHQANMTDKTEKGRQAHSGRCGRTRLTVEEVREIRLALATYPMWLDGRSLGNRAGSPPGLRKLLAERYGVSAQTIWKIGRRDQWPYVA
jgi:hypothetical protein